MKKHITSGPGEARCLGITLNLYLLPYFDCWHFIIYEHDKFHTQLRKHEKII